MSADTRPDRFAAAAQLDEWVDEGRLAEGSVDAALDAAARPDAPEWRKACVAFCAFAAALLGAASLIFFFAHNWDQMGRIAKFGLALGAFSGALGAALWRSASGKSSAPLFFAAQILEGAALALVGQTYQTGADPWQLFAVWAVASLPLAAASRSGPNWCLQLALALAAWALFCAQTRGLFAGFDERLLSGTLGFALIAAAHWLGLHFFEAETCARRAAFAATLAAASFGVVAALYSGASPAGQAAYFLTAAAAFALAYRLYRVDSVAPAELGLVALAALFVLSAFYFKLFSFSHGGDMWLASLLYAALCAGYAAQARKYIRSLSAGERP